MRFGSLDNGSKFIKRVARPKLGNLTDIDGGRLWSVRIVDILAKVLDVCGRKFAIGGLCRQKSQACHIGRSVTLIIINVGIGRANHRPMSGRKSG